MGIYSPSQTLQIFEQREVLANSSLRRVHLTASISIVIYFSWIFCEEEFWSSRNVRNVTQINTNRNAHTYHKQTAIVDAAAKRWYTRMRRMRKQGSASRQRHPSESVSTGICIRSQMR